MEKGCEVEAVEGLKVGGPLLPSELIPSSTVNPHLLYLILTESGGFGKSVDLTLGSKDNTVPEVLGLCLIFKRELFIERRLSG